MTDAVPGKAWTIRDLLGWATLDFQKRGIETARLDAEILLGSALSCSRVDLYLRFETCPDPSALVRFREMVLRRRGREPVAYIIGKKAFHDIEIIIGPGLFVPRPETELLVDEAVARLRGRDARKTKVLDLGTGSGAIALAILHALPGLQVWAADLDPKAGESLSRNAERLGLAGQAIFREGDLFAAVPGEGPFDLVAMNPPYVPAGEIAGLMPEVRDYEPRLALDGGPEGLDLIRRLIAAAPRELKPGGWLVLEVGEGQAEKVAALAADPLQVEAIRKDLRGVPRIVIFNKILDF